MLKFQIVSSLINVDLKLIIFLQVIKAKKIGFLGNSQGFLCVIHEHY